MFLIEIVSECNKRELNELVSFLKNIYLLFIFLSIEYILIKIIKIKNNSKDA